MSVIAVGLENPGGTISLSGRSVSGSTAEIALIGSAAAPIVVGTNPPDAHYLSEFKYSVAKSAQGTIFRLYAKKPTQAQFTQVDDYDCGDYGILVATIMIAHKFKAGEMWYVSGQQTTAARMAIRVGGQAKVSDLRDF